MDPDFIQFVNFESNGTLGNSENSQQILQLFFKLKNEIDIINQQINVQNNILRLVEKIRRRRRNQNGIVFHGLLTTEDAKFDRYYLYCRRKLSKLKKIHHKKSSSKINLYNILYELYRFILIFSTDEKQSSTKESNSKEQVPKTSIFKVNHESTDELPRRVVSSRLKNFEVIPKIVQRKSSRRSESTIESLPPKQLLIQCHFCSRKVKSKRALSSHASQAHKDRNIHFCDLDDCVESYSTPALLRRHKLGKHQNAIECKKCHKFFQNRNFLVQHRELVHRNSNIVQCNVDSCLKKFPTKRTLDRHLKESHIQQITTKVGQDKPSNNKKKSSKLNSNNDQKPSFQCTKCSRTFTKAFDFKVHLKAVDCTKVWCCHVENCPEMFHKLKLLTAHCSEIHQESVKFRCNWPGCTYLCNLVRGLKSHYRVHTGERPYLCNWPGCDKTFKTTSSLSDHRKQHKNELKYSCSYSGCTYKANTNCTMRSHIRIRHEKKYYKKKRKSLLVEATGFVPLTDNTNQNVNENVTIYVEHLV